MAKRSYSNVKHTARRIFNFRRMADYDRVKNYTQYLSDLAKVYFVPSSSTTQNSFEDARAKLNLTDDDLQEKQRALRRLSMLMLILALLFLAYAIYQFIYGSYLGGIPSCTLCCIALALAFRYHFWAFQIQSRKLGCTFSEWRKRNIREDNQ